MPISKEIKEIFGEHTELLPEKIKAGEMLSWFDEEGENGKYANNALLILGIGNYPYWWDGTEINSRKYELVASSTSFLYAYIYDFGLGTLGPYRKSELYEGDYFNTPYDEKFQQYIFNPSDDIPIDRDIKPGDFVKFILPNIIENGRIKTNRYDGPIFNVIRVNDSEETVDIRVSYSYENGCYLPLSVEGVSMDVLTKASDVKPLPGIYYTGDIDWFFKKGE